MCYDYFDGCNICGMAAVGLIAETLYGLTPEELRTEARTILNRGKDEAKKETTLRMLQDQYQRYI